MVTLGEVERTSTVKQVSWAGIVAGMVFVIMEMDGIEGLSLQGVS